MQANPEPAIEAGTPASPRLVIARSAATKQSRFSALQEKLDCFASLAMTEKPRLR
jgi:hypothetical protein